MNDFDTNPQGHALDWDDEISNDSPEYITLPEGEYDFTVTGFERGRYQPGPTAKFSLLCVPVRDRLFLHSSTEGFLCEFFTAIGLRRHGERVRMNWKSVLGAKGRAKVGVRSYQNDGETRTINEIKKYLEPKDPPAAAPAVQPAPAAGGQTAMSSFQAGKF